MDYVSYGQEEAKRVDELALRVMRDRNDHDNPLAHLQTANDMNALAREAASFMSDPAKKVAVTIALQEMAKQGNGSVLGADVVLNSSEPIIMNFGGYFPASEKTHGKGKPEQEFDCLTLSEHLTPPWVRDVPPEGIDYVDIVSVHGPKHYQPYGEVERADLRIY